MDFFFNATPQQLNFSLFSALNGAAAARGVRAAAVARNGGPSAPKRNPEQARLDARARQAVRTVQGFTKLKVRQKRAVKTLQKANERLLEMKQILLQARELIVKAQDPSATVQNRQDLANQFDQFLGQYNLKAKSAGHFGVNLIGASIRDVFVANDVEVQIKPGSLATTTYKGEFLGSDYVITDASGNTFLPNLFGSSVVQFPNANPNDTGTLLKNDDTVVFDSATGAVSITRAGGTSPVLQGTLTRKGIGVLHSYFYGDFQDPASRNTALQEVTDALSKLRFNITLFESRQTRATSALDFTEGQIKENRDAATRIRAQKSSAEQRFILEEQKRQLLFERTLQQSLSYNNQGLPKLTQRAFFGFNA